MNKLLRQMIGLAAAMYGASNPFAGGTAPQREVKFSDKSKSLFGEPHRELKEFSIKGYKVMAYSRKDAITRLKYQKKI